MDSLKLTLSSNSTEALNDLDLLLTGSRLTSHAREAVMTYTQNTQNGDVKAIQDGHLFLKLFETTHLFPLSFECMDARIHYYTVTVRIGDKNGWSLGFLYQQAPPLGCNFKGQPKHVIHHISPGFLQHFPMFLTCHAWTREGSHGSDARVQYPGCSQACGTSSARDTDGTKRTTTILQGLCHGHAQQTNQMYPYVTCLYTYHIIID